MTTANVGRLAPSKRKSKPPRGTIGVRANCNRTTTDANDRDH